MTQSHEQQARELAKRLQPFFTCPTLTEKDVDTVEKAASRIAEIIVGYLTTAHAAGFAEAREMAAETCDGYGREGDRLSKEYACETADEISARIRALQPAKRDGGE